MATGKPKIMSVVVLDDDPIYLKMWEKIFKNIPGCSYHLTDNTEAAKKMIKTGHVDLVICEIVLPTLDGYSIAEMTHKSCPDANVLLTTAYDCDLTRFNLKNPRFSILYKPYNNINDIQRFITHLLHNEDVYSDVTEDSFSENESYPQIVEWKL